MENEIKKYIEELIDNRSNEQQAIHHHVQAHPKEWFDFLKTEKHWLSLKCNFIDGVNRFHVFALGENLWLVDYLVEGYYSGDPNNYYLTSDYYNDYCRDGYKEKNKRILYSGEIWHQSNIVDKQPEPSAEPNEKFEIPVNDRIAEDIPLEVSVEKYKKFHSKLEALKAKHKLQRDEKSLINHPSHYTHGKFETINVITDWELSYCLGNVVKYISRCEHKGNKLLDLKKARFYIDYEIKLIEEKHGTK